MSFAQTFKAIKARQVSQSSTRGPLNDPIPVAVSKSSTQEPLKDPIPAVPLPYTGSFHELKDGGWNEIHSGCGPNKEVKSLFTSKAIICFSTFLLKGMIALMFQNEYFKTKAH